MKFRKNPFYFTVNCLVYSILILIFIYFVCNYKLYIVASGSMEPTIKTNELILVDTRISNFEIGDIISFYDNSTNIPITHRITNISDNKIFTKGDYNNTNDSNPTNSSNIIGKVIWHSYYFGVLIQKFRVVLIFILICIFILTNCLFYKRKG